MKTKIALLLISTLLIVNSASAEYNYVAPDDYTGESFFRPASSEPVKQEANVSKDRKTIPPIKRLRLSVQAWNQERKAKQTELAPTDPDANIYKQPNDTSDFASKEIEEDFDENMMPDGFEADEQAVEEHKKAKHWFKSKEEKVQKQDNSEDIVLDCDDVDYDTENYCLYATGNVNVEFVKQKTTVKADKITYDRMNNTIKAEGHVKILKGTQVIDGDYIFVDMNEENALIENPVTSTSTIDIRAKKGYVYGDKIVQENGTVDVNKSYPIKLRARGPQLDRMIVPKEATLENDMEKGLVKLKAKEITIKQKGDLEVIALRHANLKKGKWTLIKVPALKIYSNKNHDYVETNSWEIGTYRGFGAYVGPGFVFELPKGSVLKAMPVLNYSHGIGVGAIGRFNSGTNFTQAAYGTKKGKFLLHGKQQLDDNLYLLYGVNDYMDEWWLGARRPKYGVDLVYDRGYSSQGFLLKDKMSSFKHRLEVGYYQDMDAKDKHFDKLQATNVGTLRTRYMAEVSQNLFNYRNEEKQTALSFDIAAQLSASLYGTGDTQVIGRLGPRLHTQWKRWMQDIGYFQSVYDDHTPMPVFDAYRYGKSNIYFGEYFRVNKYLTLAWFTSVCLSNDSYNNKLFQENRFYVSIGPDDVKFHIGYDVMRDRSYFSVSVMTDAKGAKVDYDKLVIKQDKKAKKEKEIAQPQTDFQNSDRAPVLQYAQVEDIKTVEDVL